MINKLSIKNIQSHKDSVLEFSPRINCIVGSSNNGKSAILRALNWSIYNRPLGTDILLSSWAYNDKGKQKDDMSVEVEKDSGVLIRRKSATNNEYVLNGKVSEAIKTDVPSEVQDFFKLSETNIQKQQDAPFLLSQSSGEVAKYFNRVVRLDVIDKVLTNAESLRRKTKQEIESDEKLVKEYELKHSKFDWIPKVEKLLQKYSVVEENSNQLQKEIFEIEEQLKVYSDCEKKIEKYDFEEQKMFVSKIEKLENHYDEISEDIEMIENKLFNFEKYSKRHFDFSLQKDLIKRIEKDENYSEYLQNEINHLGTSGANLDWCEKSILENIEKIKELKNQLPDICPTCGAKMKNGECANESNNN